MRDVKLQQCERNQYKKIEKRTHMSANISLEEKENGGISKTLNQEKKLKSLIAYERSHGLCL